MPDPTPDPSTPQGGNPPSGTTPAAGDEFKPIATQDDLNHIIDERLRRERAKFADYGDLKTKAARVDQVESEAAQKIAAAEAATASVPTEVTKALRTHLVALHEIDKDDADLFLTATEPDVLLKQIERLTTREGQRKTRLRVPREGTNPGDPKEDEERKATRQLFGSGGGA